MQTIGQLLASLRQKKGLYIRDISKKTNIAVHLLEHLEHDQFENLPSSTFTKGFITSYAKVVGLPPQKALAVFRRDFVVSGTGKIMPKGLAKPLDKSTIVTSKLVTIGVIVFFVTIFFGYLGIQLKNYHAAPEIELSRPAVGAVVRGPIIAIKGFVTGDSSVYINGNLVEIFPTGEFRANVQLPSGEQIISIKAVGSHNKLSTLEIPITVVDN
jgi:transcriptional regulator with XRE-family HTH domain